MLRSTLLLVVALTLTACSSNDAPFAPTAVDEPVDAHLARAIGGQGGGISNHGVLSPAGNAQLRRLRNRDVLVSNIGSSGLDGVNVDPAQAGANFAANVRVRPYDMTDAELSIGVTGGGPDVTATATYLDASSPFIVLHLSTGSTAPQTVKATFMNDGTPCRATNLVVVDGELPFEVDADGTHLTSFGARGNGSSVSLAMGWDNTKNVKWFNAAGEEESCEADRIVLSIPRPGTAGDVTIEARPVRKDSGEAHLDYLIITMENVVVEDDEKPILPVEDVILN